MTPDQIISKASALVDFYTAKRNGKKLQLFTNSGWWNVLDEDGPTMKDDLSHWRIKPEPQRIWISGAAWTDSSVIAAALREVGQEAREFMEVTP